MDDFKTRLYMRELRNQCHYAFIAVETLNKDILPQFGEENDNPAVAEALKVHCFAVLQAALVAGATISNLLWSTTNPAADARSQHLRESLDITSIPVLQNRAIRNSLEHFDERIDMAVATPGVVIFHHLLGSDTVKAPNKIYLRWYDPETGILTVLGQDGVSQVAVDIQELCDGIALVMERVDAWLAAH